MRRIPGTILTVGSLVPAAFGWGAHGHRTITYLALDGFAKDAPAWLRDAAVRDRVAYQSNEPDRWRGWRSLALAHENGPEHYLDVEALEEFGLTLETVPRLRGEYLRTLIIAKYVHPENVSPYDPSKDPSRSHEWPGFALHAIAEHYAKLQAEFNTVRILERLKDPARRRQLEQARANAIYEMGILSHLVADLAQPLHTTVHHHGWVGDNPEGYTTDRGIHRRIDTGVLMQHRLTYAALKPHMKYDVTINPVDPWDDVLGYFRRSHAAVEPLYRLERDGLLDTEPGRAFMIERIADAVAMLSAMYQAAWRSAAPTDQQVADWVRYNHFDAEAQLKGSSGKATTTPAATSPAGDPGPG